MVGEYNEYLDDLRQRCIRRGLMVDENESLELTLYANEMAQASGGSSYADMGYQQTPIDTMREILMPEVEAEYRQELSDLLKTPEEPGADEKYSDLAEKFMQRIGFGNEKSVSSVADSSIMNVGKVFMSGTDEDASSGVEFETIDEGNEDDGIIYDDEDDLEGEPDEYDEGEGFEDEEVDEDDGIIYDDEDPDEYEDDGIEGEEENDFETIDEVDEDDGIVFDDEDDFEGEEESDFETLGEVSDGTDEQSGFSEALAGVSDEVDEDDGIVYDDEDDLEEDPDEYEEDDGITYDDEDEVDEDDGIIYDDEDEVDEDDGIVYDDEDDLEEDPDEYEDDDGIIYDDEDEVDEDDGITYDDEDDLEEDPDEYEEDDGITYDDEDEVDEDDGITYDDEDDLEEEEDDISDYMYNDEEPPVQATPKPQAVNQPKSVTTADKTVDIVNRLIRKLER